MGNGKRQSARPAARQVSKQSTELVPSQPHSSPPLTTIHDLPLEIIGRIITIAYSAPSANPSECRERYRFLKASSLVCREWTPFAQEALWFDVSLYDQAIRTFLEAGAGRHATHKLSVYSGIRRDASLEGVLRDVRGVRNLQLSSCTVSMDWLCGDNFKDLKTLHLSCVTDSAASTSTLLPFALTTLKLTFFEDPSSFPLIGALSRQSSITSLLVATREFYPNALFARLAPLAPGLHTLDIISLRGVPEAADDFLQGCTHLKHLKTYNTPLNAVKLVAVSLASWTVDSVYEVSTILDILERGSVATAKLETLVLERSERSSRNLPRWADLVQTCKEKKIKLVAVDHSGKSETIV